MFAPGRRGSGQRPVCKGAVREVVAASCIPVWGGDDWPELVREERGDAPLSRVVVRSIRRLTDADDDGTCSFDGDAAEAATEDAEGSYGADVGEAMFYGNGHRFEIFEFGLGGAVHAVAWRNTKRGPSQPTSGQCSSCGR